jgi:TetR/AcrR family transcriptional repressor of nem operon
LRYPAEQTAERHERILAAASRLVRERGFDGVGIAEVMKEAGLTHGAFYAHFDSKDELAAAALDRALAEMLELADVAVSKSGDPLSNFASSYLSTKHRDNPGFGCAMATLGADVSRRSPEIRRAFTVRLASLFSRLSPKSPNDAVERARIIGTFSTLVGAMILARAVDGPELSDEVLRATRDFL